MHTRIAKTSPIADTERALTAGCPGSDLHCVREADGVPAGSAFSETWLSNALQFAFGSATVAVIESHGTTDWQ